MKLELYTIFHNFIYYIFRFGYLTLLACRPLQVAIPYQLDWRWSCGAAWSALCDGGRCWRLGRLLVHFRSDACRARLPPRCHLLFEIFPHRCLACEPLLVVLFRRTRRSIWHCCGVSQRREPPKAFFEKLKKGSWPRNEFSLWTCTLFCMCELYTFPMFPAYSQAL